MQFYQWLAGVSLGLQPAQSVSSVDPDSHFFHPTSIIPTGLAKKDTIDFAVTGHPQFGKRMVRARTLAATYHYSCPIGGRDSRYFVWKVVQEGQRVQLKSLHNIDYWGRIQTQQTHFGCFWYHTRCIEKPDRTCTYSFRGFTEGDILPAGISMVLITQGTDARFLPRVEERCVLILPRPEPESCPSSETVAPTSCVINSIDINVSH